MLVTENNKSKNEIRNIITATGFSFTICMICVAVFQFLLNGAEVTSNLEVGKYIFVSFAICLCMSVWGFVCFSEKVVLKASKLVRFIVFAVFGYGIIAAWVFGSGWCPIEGFGLFTIICIAALVFAGVITFAFLAIEDKRLNEQLDSYKSM